MAGHKHACLMNPAAGVALCCRQLATQHACRLLGPARSRLMVGAVAPSAGVLNHHLATHTRERFSQRVGPSLSACTALGGHLHCCCAWARGVCASHFPPVLHPPALPPHPHPNVKTGSSQCQLLLPLPLQPCLGRWQAAAGTWRALLLQLPANRGCCCGCGCCPEGLAQTWGGRYLWRHTTRTHQVQTLAIDLASSGGSIRKILFEMGVGGVHCFVWSKGSDVHHKVQSLATTLPTASHPLINLNLRTALQDQHR